MDCRPMGKMKTAIICGNGPSYNEMPQELLLQYDSFGVNYCAFQPTYFVCVDHAILTEHHRKIYPLAAGAKRAFLAAKEYGSSDLYDLKNVTLVRKDEDAFKDEKFFSGLTVAYVALKMAFYLGYEEIILWGIDHSPNWEHYDPTYPPGDRDRRQWRMEMMELHYAIANKVYNDSGRRIINYSHPSKLDAIFERGKENK